MKRGASFRKLGGPAILFNVFRGELAQRSDGRYTHLAAGASLVRAVLSRVHEAVVSDAPAHGPKHSTIELLVSHA